MQRKSSCCSSSGGLSPNVCPGPRESSGPRASSSSDWDSVSQSLHRPFPPITLCRESKTETVTCRFEPRRSVGGFKHRQPRSLSVSKAKNTNIARSTEESSSKKSVRLEQSCRMILPKLTLKDLATYHNSQGHNCCLEMLEVGYHRSFQVLHNIIRIQRKKQEEADPGSGIWRQPLLENDPHKLSKITTELMKAEKLERFEQKNTTKLFAYIEGTLVRGTPPALLARYNAESKLGKHLLDIGDIWMAKFFFQLSHESAMRMRKKSQGDFAFQWAESLHYVCATTDVDPEFERTARALEALLADLRRVYDECLGKAWTIGSSSFEHETTAKICLLVELGTKLADTGGCQRPTVRFDNEKALSYFVEANSLALHVNDRMVEAKTRWASGKHFQAHGDYENAITDFETCDLLYMLNDDTEGVMGARCAMGQCFMAMGAISMALPHFEQTEKLASGIEQIEGMAKANACIAAARMAQGDGAEAEIRLRTAYGLSCRGGNHKQKEEMRVRYGILSATKAMTSLEELTSRPPCEDLRADVFCITSWKNNGIVEEDEDHGNLRSNVEEDATFWNDFEGFVGKMWDEGFDPLRQRWRWKREAPDDMCEETRESEENAEVNDTRTRTPEHDGDAEQRHKSLLRDPSVDTV